MTTTAGNHDRTGIHAHLVDITRQADLIAATIQGTDPTWSATIQAAIDAIHADAEHIDAHLVTDRPEGTERR